MMWGYGPGYNGGFWGIGIFGMIIQMLFWLLVLVLVIYLFRRMSNRMPTGGTLGRPGPLDILRERYARGEMDTEEYQRRREELSKS